MEKNGSRLLDSKSYNEVYEILKSLKEISDVQFNRLVSVYGVDFVVDVMKKIVKEDKEYLSRFSKYNLNIDLDNSTMDLEDDTNYEEINAVESYIRDVSMVSEIGPGYKDILVDEIIKIVDRLNQLFTLVGCNELKFDNGRHAWIADKVEYSLENCSDESLKMLIGQLYGVFVDKRNHLMDGYLKFVISIAKEYYRSYGLLLEDLIQLGNLGLMRAIENYNKEYNIKFSTYAYKWINQSILANSKKMMYQVRKPSHIFEYNNDRIKTINELSYELGRTPNNREIAQYMGISLEMVKLIESAFLGSVSLDEEVESQYDGVYTTKKDSIVDESVNVEDDVINVCLAEELNKYLEMFLDEREQFVIKSRYVDDMTFLEIASILGVTHQWIGQIHKKAITKLRRKRRIKQLKSYLG